MPWFGRVAESHFLNADVWRSRATCLAFVLVFSKWTVESHPARAENVRAFVKHVDGRSRRGHHLKRVSARLRMQLGAGLEPDLRQRLARRIRSMWDPKKLKKDDVVGVLVSLDGDLMVYVNDQQAPLA